MSKAAKRPRMSFNRYPPNTAAAIGASAFESWARRLIRVRAGLERPEGDAIRPRRPRARQIAKTPGIRRTARGHHDDSK